MTTKKRNKKYNPNKVATVKTVRKTPLGPLTDHEHRLLKEPPLQSLLAMSKGEGTPTDWFNVAFRIMSTVKIAEFIYVDETVAQIREGFELCEQIYNRAKETNDWNPTPQELETLEACVEAADAIQHEADRKTQIFCYKKARVALQRFL